MLYFFQQDSWLKAGKYKNTAFDIYLPEVIHGNIRLRCEISSKLAISKQTKCNSEQLLLTFQLSWRNFELIQLHFFISGSSSSFQPKVFSLCVFTFFNNPAGIYLFKVSKRNNRTKCETFLIKRYQNDVIDKCYAWALLSNFIFSKLPRIRNHLKNLTLISNKFAIFKKIKIAKILIIVKIFQYLTSLSILT